MELLLDFLSNKKQHLPTVSCGLKKTHWICSELAENGRWTRRGQKINPLSQTPLQKAASGLHVCFGYAISGMPSFGLEQMNKIQLERDKMMLFSFGILTSFLSFLFL